jgi:hypothetical protein
VEVVQEVGMEGDRTVCWDLKVHTNEPIRLIHRQEKAKVVWFGQVLSAWSGIPLEVPLADADRKPTEIDEVYHTHRATMPDGFSMTYSGRSQLGIDYYRTGMGCLNVFMLVWTLGWTSGTALFTYLEW